MVLVRMSVTVSLVDDSHAVLFRPCTSARPINDEGERVTPSDLIEYRRSHDFKGPCCLCASLDADLASYTESSIFLATCRPSSGKYVAACATGQCRYWGESSI